MVRLLLFCSQGLLDGRLHDQFQQSPNRHSKMIGGVLELESLPPHPQHPADYLDLHPPLDHHLHRHLQTDACSSISSC